jgi:hypothetical protein
MAATTTVESPEFGVAIMGRVLVEMVMFSVAITMGGGVGQRQSWRKQLLWWVLGGNGGVSSCDSDSGRGC